jgi:putative redox protein
MTNPPNASSAVVSAEDAGGWVTARIGRTGFRTDATARKHTQIVDEPVAVGGTDLGPTPYESLLTALGACTAMTLRLYADRKKWPLVSVSVQMRSGQSHQKDCEDCPTKKVGIGTIQRRLELEGALTDEQRTRLREIADRCPVKQTLERGIHIEAVDTLTGPVVQPAT